MEEYRSGTESFNRAADQRILNEIAGPAHYVMHLADAAIAEMEAERDALRGVYRELTGKDWNWDPRPREGDDVTPDERPCDARR